MNETLELALMPFQLAFMQNAFLVTLILTLVPVTALLKKLLSPLLRGRTQRQKAYFAAPSGE